MCKFIDMDKLVLPKGTVDKIQKKGVPAILDWLAEQESIDIVRCQDCIHSVYIEGRYFCDIQYNEWGQPYIVKPDGYCDVGERRETDDRPNQTND